MYVAVPLTLILGSLAAAAPSLHARISVDGVTHTTNLQNQTNNLPSSQSGVKLCKQPVMSEDDELPLSSLPFNFILFARSVNGAVAAATTTTLPGLPVGFADLTLADGHARAELRYKTEFALRDGKLINGNRGLEYHVAKVFPPWLSLWSFDKRHTYLKFAAYPNPVEEGGGGIITS